MTLAKKLKTTGDCGDKAKAEDTYKIINGNQYKIINTASTSKYSIGRYTLRDLGPFFVFGYFLGPFGGFDGTNPNRGEILAL